jgi:hypothetical protein
MLQDYSVKVRNTGIKSIETMLKLIKMGLKYLTRGMNFFTLGRFILKPKQIKMSPILFHPDCGIINGLNLSLCRYLYVSM